MKKIILTSWVALITTFTFAQKNTVVGTVNDKQGKPIPFAFIKDAQRSYATFTDLNGAFNLKVDSVDRLIVSAQNFKKTVIKIGDPNNVNVVLTGDDAAGAKLTKSTGDFKEKLSTEGMTKDVSSGYIVHENTIHGSRYLFENWVHGYALTTEDSVKQNDNYLFNYEKMAGNLIFTDDGKTMTGINRHSIKMFTLVDDQGQTYVFENRPEIDPLHFVQVISTGSKYKIYKQLGTKYLPNNYVSNGMTSSGNNYDEFKDESVYYVVKLPGGQPQKVLLKKKSIKTVFAADADKANKFLSDNDRDIDDDYLKSLGDYMNQ
ncbi:carboxypeptidase-like regulatory domain-containing protein [Mucilaginibacter sp. McL0603]|uniref:carboxypeptidase-like regulatory domain-containing protein n=1 Tax=Mucilaginibacter sp. McL0603 TaxID=3415670 RepID=UPI003CEF1287